jgi:tripartite-type tricarboxylate transporter receptor subunit TctC
MTNRFIKNYLFAAALLATVLLASCGADQGRGTGSEADGEHSFAGQTITVVIGLDASAGGTTVGRLLAKHLEMNLAGNPTVIVNNMPGASGLNAHLHVLLRAPDDGTTVYYGPRSSLGELLELPGFTFKYSQFTPLGGVQIGGLVVYARTDSTSDGLSGPQDIVATEVLRFGGMPPEHGRMIVSTMGLDLIGANYKYIAGYPSSGNIRAAVISGEVNTATDAAHAYLNQVVPVLVDEGLAMPIFSMPMLNGDGELVQNAMVPDVPSLPDLYESLNGEAPSGIVWDSIATLLELDQTMQHVFLGPPDMDAAAAETFRAGLQKAMTSAAFLEEAQQVLSYVPGPVNHERQAKILGATANVSPEVLEYIRSHIEKNSGY